MTPQQQLTTTVLLYAFIHLNESIRIDGVRDPRHKKLADGIQRYLNNSKFSTECSKKLVELEKSEWYDSHAKQGRDLALYALILLSVWYRDTKKSDRTMFLWVSNEYINRGRSQFAIEMLQLKQRNEEDYIKTREVIDDSERLAVEFYEKMKKEIFR